MATLRLREYWPVVRDPLLSKEVMGNVRVMKMMKKSDAISSLHFPECSLSQSFILSCGFLFFLIDKIIQYVAYLYFGQSKNRHSPKTVIEELPYFKFSSHIKIGGGSQCTNPTILQPLSPDNFGIFWHLVAKKLKPLTKFSKNWCLYVTIWIKF